MDEPLSTAIEWVTRLLEAAGVAVIVIGALAATFYYLKGLGGGGDKGDALGCYRTNLGRAILLGLEFLVAADIVNTVAFNPTLHSLATLGGIVLIRTFLSFALEVELEGRWPWQRHQAGGA